MKKGKCVKLNGYKSYKVNYGTVDSKILKSIYLNIKTWAEPKLEIESPVRVINNLSRAIKHRILSIIDKKTFKDKFIVDLDLRASGIHLGKKSFMNLECVIYFNDTILDFKSKEVKNSIKLIADAIINNELNNNKNFDFFLTKHGNLIPIPNE